MTTKVILQIYCGFNYIFKKIRNRNRVINRRIIMFHYGDTPFFRSSFNFDWERNKFGKKLKNPKEIIFFLVMFHYGFVFLSWSYGDSWFFFKKRYVF